MKSMCIFLPTLLLANYMVTHVTHINSCIVGDTSILCTCICGHSTNQSRCAYQPRCELKEYPSLLCQLDLNLGSGLMFSPVVSEGVFFLSLCYIQSWNMG
jgi:hypothetical protein